MNRYLTSLTALALLAACQDSTAPPSGGPGAGRPGTRCDRTLARARRRGGLAHRAPPVGRGQPERHPRPRQQGHRCDLARHRALRGHLRPQRRRLCLHRDDPERLQPGARRVHRQRPPEPQGRLHRDQEPGRRAHRRSLQPPGRLRSALHPVRGRRLLGEPGAGDLGHHAQLRSARAATRSRSPPAWRGCAYLATVADPGNGLVFNPSGVYTGKGPDSRTVYIETKNPGGGLQDGVPFHLSVICPGTGSSRFVVVKANGGKQRGSVGTASILGSTGNYQVSNDINVSSCAALATRGSPSTAVPFSPATVEITPGATAKSFGVQVRAAAVLRRGAGRPGVPRSRGLLTILDPHLRRGRATVHAPVVLRSPF